MLNTVFDYLGAHYEAVLAFCALALTCWQFYASHKHNKISVRPHITGYSHVDWEGEDSSYSFEIKNNGLGAAIIDRFEISFKGKSLSWYSHEELRTEIEKILKPAHVTHLEEFKAGHAVGRDEEIKILSFSIAGRKKFSEIKKVVEKFTVKISYSSMYKEKQSDFITDAFKD